MKTDYDVVIVGGGPGGATCAAYLWRAGRNVLLLDKARFPRDKICGDALSGKSIKELKKLGLTQTIEENPNARIYGITFSSPNGSEISVPVPPHADGSENYGYCVRREVFDNLVFQEGAKKATVATRVQVERVTVHKDHVRVEAKDLETEKRKVFTAQALVGADGANSVVARALGVERADAKHTLVAIRAYYKGVTGMTRDIELHFTKELVPGYFWVFPLEDGLANVGLGLPMDAQQKQRLNLKEVLEKIIKENPKFKARFQNAKLIGPIKGWNLPVGSTRRTTAGERIVLIGDAASLIDPFTGEGIGNAMLSGRLAAEELNAALTEGDLSKKRLMAYHNKLWAALGTELKGSTRLQWMARYPFIMNRAIGKAAKNPELLEEISATLTQPNPTSSILSNLTLLRLFI